MIDALSTIHELEMEWIIFIQHLGDLDQVMRWISYLGWDVLPYATAFVYFCISRRAGARLYLLFSFSTSFLESLRMAFHSPRPYWLDSRVQAFAGAGNYGMPSGHVYGATITWSFVARTMGKSWAWATAFLIVFLVSISRIYLGMHFISDVVVAWCVAAILLWLYRWSEPVLTARLTKLDLIYQIGLGFCAATALVMIGLIVGWLLDGVVDPPQWAEAAAGARSVTGLVGASGQFFGAACGVAMCSRWSRFEIPSAWWKRLAALAYALINTWLIAELWTMIPVSQDFMLRLGLEFFKGSFSKWWIIFAVPWILVKADYLKLTSEI